MVMNAGTVYLANGKLSVGLFRDGLNAGELEVYLIESIYMNLLVLEKYIQSSLNMDLPV